MPYRTNDEWDDYGQPDAPMDDWGSQKEAQQDTDTEKKASREELKRFLFGGVSPTLITHFYLQRYRWIWFVPSKSSQTSILDAISVSRLSEGFYPLSDETFFYQVCVHSSIRPNPFPFWQSLSSPLASPNQLKLESTFFDCRPPHG